MCPARFEPSSGGPRVLRVHSGGDGDGECYLLPVDRAYELVGRLRLNWQGFDGGSGARAELAAFFDDVRQRAAPVAPREGLPT